MEPRVVDNPKESRYELWLGDTRAGFIDYLSEPGTVLLVHTEVDPALEGQGLGARLVAGALADLRARGLKLVPCARSSAPTYAATPRTPTWSAAAGAPPNDHVDAAGGQGRRPTRTSHVILPPDHPGQRPALEVPPHVGAANACVPRRSRSCPVIHRRGYDPPTLLAALAP